MSAGTWTAIAVECWKAFRRAMMQVAFDSDALTNMVFAADCLTFDQNTGGGYVDPMDADNVDYMASFVMKNFVQDLVVWGQCWKDGAQKYESLSLESLDLIPPQEIEDNKVATTSKKIETYEEANAELMTDTNDEAIALAALFYKRKTIEAGKEIGKIAHSLWLLQQSFSGCLDQRRHRSTKDLYAYVLSFLGISNEPHIYTSDYYMTVDSAKSVVKITFSVPGTDEIIEGCGEGVSEEEAMEESFGSLLLALCSRFEEYLAGSTNIANDILFSRVHKDQPKTIRRECYDDLTNAVQFVSNWLAVNPHHIRISAMWKDFEDWLLELSINFLCESISQPQEENELEIYTSNACSIKWDTKPAVVGLFSSKNHIKRSQVQTKYPAPNVKQEIITQAGVSSSATSTSSTKFGIYNTFSSSSSYTSISKKQIVRSKRSSKNSVKNNISTPPSRMPSSAVNRSRQRYYNRELAPRFCNYYSSQIGNLHKHSLTTHSSNSSYSTYEYESGPFRQIYRNIPSTPSMIVAMASPTITNHYFQQQRSRNSYNNMNTHTYTFVNRKHSSRTGPCLIKMKS